LSVGEAKGRNAWKGRVKERGRRRAAREGKADGKRKTLMSIVEEIEPRN